MKDLQIKRKHHYVWAYYLKGWTSDGLNVWYISKKGNASFDSIRGIGCEKDFYKVGVLSEYDIKLIKMWINECSPELKYFHMRMVEFVSRIQAKAQFLEKIAKKKLEVDLNELVANNLFENCMSMRENDTVAVLQKLREGDLSCLENKKSRWDFSHFLGLQFSRTKRMRDALLYSNENSKFDEKIKKIWRDFYKKHWWFLCYFFGTNLSKDIALNPKSKIKILTNSTDEPFITSDQPVINLNPKGELGCEIDYYYPISDKVALAILNSGFVDIDDEITNKSDVQYLNEKIARFSGDTIYSSDKNTLLLYRHAFNKRNFKFK